MTVVDKSREFDDVCPIGKYEDFPMEKRLYISMSYLDGAVWSCSLFVVRVDTSPSPLSFRVKISIYLT
jgi:hypothetical protein